MKDNYSWLDQSLRAIIDYKDPEIAIVEVKSRVAKQFEIEKLRARIDELNNLDCPDDVDHFDMEIIIEERAETLEEKLKELEG